MKLALLALALTAFLGPAAAQTAPVSGIVVAGNGLPVAGATVTAGGASAVTGADGRFRLAPPTAASQLTVTAPGYTRVEVDPAHAGRIVLVPSPVAESVTVTASAANQSTAAVPMAVSVIGSERLHTAAPANVDSILRETSALGTFRVNSSQTANPTTQGVALLGTGSSGASRALVLLDGFPLNDIFGGWVDWLRVPDQDVSGISVVSGGASPLYGNDALSGVIGIDTAPPIATHLDLRTGGGGLSTGLADGVGVIAARRLALAVRGRGIHVGGYIPAAQPGPIDTNAGVTAQDWSPELRYIPSPAAMFTVSSEYFAEQRRNGTALQVNGTRLRQLAARAVIDHDGIWNASAFTQSEDFDATFSSIAAARAGERLTLEQQVPSRAQGMALDWTLADTGPRQRWSLTSGTSYIHITAVDNETTPPATSTSRAENGRQRLSGAFIETRWSPLTSWSWTATLRRDGWSNYDAFQSTPGGITPFPTRVSVATSPALGTVYAVRPWLSLRASAYESFRAPTLNELYRPFRAGNVLTNANPLLAAERYRGAQAGAELRPLTSVRLDFTYFDGTVANLVTSVTLSTTPSLITRQRQNLGRVRPKGETFEGQWQARSNLTLWGSYTHLTSPVISAPVASLVGLAVAHVPDNNFAARGEWRVRGFRLAAVERFGGANFDDDQNTLPLPAFWNTDLFLSRGFDFDQAAIAPYLGVENLWNRRHAIELTPEADLNAPRALTAGLRLQWGRR
ncbi:MAG TPA: TonB-dependent receptor [Terriglobales bacterium]|nr:TonB-dependent receptor [Terriglobales bacterium]